MSKTYMRTILVLAGMTLLASVGEPAVPGALAASPISSFLLKPGEAPGIGLGKAQVFRKVSAVKDGAGERPTTSEVRRYEGEGLIEAAIVRLHVRGEPAASGISSVFDFETTAGAKAEMEAEVKEAFNRQTLGTASSAYFTLRRLKVPGVRNAAAFEFVTNRAAHRIGVESGVAKGLFVEGSCLLSVGIFQPTSKKVAEPIIRGVQAISRRTAGRCP